MSEFEGSIREAVARARERGEAHEVVMRNLHGTSDEVALAADVTRLCEQLVGSVPKSAFFYRASVSAVVGLRFEDDTCAFTKFHNRDRYTEEHLTAVHAVSRRLFERGFPCPEPLAFVGSPQPVTVMSCFDRGEVAAESSLTTERGRAIALARLVRASLDCSVERAALRLFAHDAPPTGTPWPGSHSPLIDFDVEREKALWIEDIGRNAIFTSKSLSEQMPDEDWVIGHMDWGLGNLRFSGDEVVAAFDFEALARAREFVVVGQSANLEMFDHFVSSYEEARGRVLTDEERRGAKAAAVASLGYGARCEHAQRPHDPWPGSMRERLARFGAEFRSG